MYFQSNFPGSGGFLSPKKIVDDLEIIKKGMKIADFGSGAGYFTLPLAQKVGETGRVFAIDVLAESLEVVNSKIKIEGIKNVETIRCNLEKENGCELKNGTCDIIWMANLLFQTENDKTVAQETKRVLKDDGIIVLIEWYPESAFGPQGKKIGKEEAIKLFEDAGFSLQKEFPADSYHYGLIFKKQ
jgi:ubiquinone/menaquinone biosynthesis C-methylase UbiE